MCSHSCGASTLKTIRVRPEGRRTIDMSNEIPDQQDIDQFLEFPPVLRDLPELAWPAGASPIWVGIEPHSELDRFLDVASQVSWTAQNYGAHPIIEKIDGHQINADEIKDIGDIQALLTWCVRGERFCAGHWIAVFNSGLVRTILERLHEIRWQENE